MEIEIKTYRAGSMQEALRQVRSELGPGASVLHTREMPLSRLLGWLPGMRRIEVTASADVAVPARFPQAEETYPLFAEPAYADEQPTAVARQLEELQSLVEDLCRRTRGPAQPDLPDALFTLYAELLDLEMSEEVARDLVDRVRLEAMPHELVDTATLRARAAAIVERDVIVAAPIQPGAGHCRVVALVGPTGVGKTTTIAKLAANFRLRDKWNVGLITVDTYRIAAVEQLRTYADIIDLPMRVVSTPREMREAVERMSHLDLLLIEDRKSVV